MAGRYSIRCICRVAFLGSFLFCSQPLLASEVNFDAPAMLTARPLSHDDIVLRGEKLVEVIIPVSSQIRPDIRAAMSEFRFDVFWNRSAYPVIDYGPRTRTTTGVDGTISVERRSDRQRTLGISLNSGYERYRDWHCSSPALKKKWNDLSLPGNSAARCFGSKRYGQTWYRCIFQIPSIEAGNPGGWSRSDRRFSSPANLAWRHSAS